LLAIRCSMRAPSIKPLPGIADSRSKREIAAPGASPIVESAHFWRRVFFFGAAEPDSNGRQVGGREYALAVAADATGSS